MDKIFYDGWELEYFDKAYNFRSYQFDLVKKFIKGKVAEVGPGNGAFLKYYLPLVDKIDLFETIIIYFLNIVYYEKRI